MFKTLFFLFLFFVSSCMNLSSKNNKDPEVDIKTLFGNDYRLFQKTPVWDLAKAVRDEKTSEIRNIIKSKKINVDFQEPKFGSTLLMLTVLNEQFNSAKVLLECGADPNKHDTCDGKSAMIYSAGIQHQSEDNTKFLKLMLSHGGNPNDEETGERKQGNSTRKTPLLVACDDVIQDVTPIEKVKLLVEAEADINHKNDFGATPLKEALRHYDVILYFLQKGVNYTVPLFKNLQEKDVTLVEKMRYDVFPLDSKKYKDKMAVANFLEQKGVEYRKLPIPKKVIERAKNLYPNNWQEYLEKY